MRSLLSEEIFDRPGVIEPALGELRFLAALRALRFPVPDDAGPDAICAACAGAQARLWLAQALARASGKCWKPGALRRVKRRRSQAGLSASERRGNVGGAIEAGARFEGKTIVVVDDVFTMGATLEACARALRKAGAAEVHGQTLARVVRPTDILL